MQLTLEIKQLFVIFFLPQTRSIRHAP